MNEAILAGLSTQNRLLSAIPKAELDLLRPHLSKRFFAAGTLIANPGDIVNRCYFPERGMISLLSVTEFGGSIEVGFIGVEGLVGLAAILGKTEVPYEALVQADTDCLVADAAIVRELFFSGGIFHDLLLHYTYALFRQVSQTCVCNHFHTIEARLCRWLTVICERSENKHLSLTQEFLARMLGVQRTSVGLIANSMQRQGVIKYARGRVEIVDFERLSKMACECYRIVKEEYAKLYQTR